MSTSDALTAAHAFRRYFSELRDTYLERDALFTQIELALLCREHVLVIGPPGTAKSAIASAVLGRITDDRTGATSLFAKQLSESTVQTDLIGPVDFKVLTETGRTEYLTDDGMLGATFGFLDEVFDGRDMLLRSILNVLHERELKHGKRVTAGQLETAIMTSNRYLSEVLARSPELLLAFADRLSFVSFVPKSFARPSSRAAMMSRFSADQRPDFKATLTLQHLDALQHWVEEVDVPSAIMESIELLSDQLERLLQAQVARLPDYVPTKYFSQRSIVKALWALKAAVVRDRIWRHPDRPLVAADRDLDMLRYFFLLGGPSTADAEAMLKVAVDPRERAQLEIVRLEARAFADAIAKVRTDVTSGVAREAADLKAGDEQVAAEGISRTYAPAQVSATARTLREKLVPGPRHPQNRQPLVSAARALVTAVEQRLARAHGAERGATGLLTSFGEVMELARLVPELSVRSEPLATRLLEYTAQALEMIALSAESTEFEGTLKVDALATLAGTIEQELAEVRELIAVIEGAAGAKVAPVRAQEQRTRERVVASIRRRAAAAFDEARGSRAGDPYEALTADSRRLTQLEARLTALSPDQDGFKQSLLAPIAVAYARQVLGGASFQRIEQLGLAVQSVSENLRKQGIDPVPMLGAARDLIEQRIQQHAAALASGQHPPAPNGAAVFSGEAYNFYRSELSGAKAPEGELNALAAVETQLFDGPAAALSPTVKEAVAQAELSALHQRISFLRGWVAQLVGQLPDPAKLKGRPEAERAFDQLVKSRFPMLAMKEGELVRLQSAVANLSRQPGQVGEGARALEKMLRSLTETFGDYSRRLLEARAAL